MALDDVHDDDKRMQDDSTDLDVPEPPVVVDSGETSEGGKLKMIVQLVKRCLGVKDIAAMRLSLPASLMEPIPNLEYWHYLDRPDLFAAINDSDDPFERMLAVLRFCFSKELKVIHGKVCKPYNSVLGEHFRAHWDVIPIGYSSDPSEPPIFHQDVTPLAGPPRSTRSSESTSALSFRSNKSKTSLRSKLHSVSTPTIPIASTAEAVGESNIAAQLSELSLGNASGSGSGSIVEDTSDGSQADNRLRVVFLTEQVSHHPPISSFHAACPARGVEMAGIDQLSAKISGTTVRVASGSFNKGIFIHLTSGAGEGEKYHVSHPVASVNGILRGSFYVTIGESTIITCEGGKKGEKLRAIIEYKEESWLGRPQFAVEGIIHTYKEGDSSFNDWTKVKHVPRSCIVAQFDGSWRGHVRWKRPGETDAECSTLLDLSHLHVIPKRVRPLEKQLPDESRRLWDSVTTRLLAKEYGDATKYKLAIEQRQRDQAAERKRTGENFVPVYFERDIESGRPCLTAEGRKAIEEELKASYHEEC